MSEKYMESVTHILSSIDSMSKQIDQYQKDKKRDAKRVARSIDRHTLYDKKIDELKKLKKYTKTEELLDKFNKLEEELKKALEENEEDINNEINTSTVVDAIFSAPSGDDLDMLVNASMFLRQKNNEKVPRLTQIYIEDLRDSFLIKLATDVKVWDKELRQLVGSLIQMTRLVSLGIKQDNRQYDGEENEYKNASEVKESIDKSSQYQVM